MVLSEKRAIVEKAEENGSLNTGKKDIRFQRAKGKHAPRHRASRSNGILHKLNLERPKDFEERAKKSRDAALIMLIAATVLLATSPQAESIMGSGLALPFNNGAWQVVISAAAIAFGWWTIFSKEDSITGLYGAAGVILPSAAVLILFAFSVISVFTNSQSGLFYELAMIAAAILLSQWIKYEALSSSANALDRLLDSIPFSANLVKNNEVLPERSQKLAEGDMVRVHEGQTVPVDGIVAEGDALIGYPVVYNGADPLMKGYGDWVSAGARIEKGSFAVETVSAGKDTGIIRLATGAQRALGTLPPMQALVIVIARVVAVVASMVSVAAFLMWLFLGKEGINEAVQVAMAVLAIASVEALALSVRVVSSDGMAFAANQGISFKDAGALERSAGVDTVVFDGVGSLLENNPPLSDVIPAGKLTKPGLLRLSASLARAAESSFAMSITRKAHQEAGSQIPEPTRFEIVEGCGVSGTIETRDILLGNERLMAERNIDTDSVCGEVAGLTAQGKKILYVAADGKIAGLLAFHFKPHPIAKKRVEALKNMGIKVALLTSENQRTVDALAQDFGLDIVYTVIQPAHRIEKIGEIKSQGKRVAVVSRHSSDNELIKAADLSISGHPRDIGSQQVADIAFLNDDVFDVASALRLGEAARGAMRQNTILAVAFNIIAIPLAAGVLYPALGIVLRPEIAALGMLASVWLVVKNSTRLRMV